MEFKLMVGNLTDPVLVFALLPLGPHNDSSDPELSDGESSGEASHGKETAGVDISRKRLLAVKIERSRPPQVTALVLPTR
jgi:hypothetical protein